jgi:hypothetical protein
LPLSPRLTFASHLIIDIRLDVVHPRPRPHEHVRPVLVLAQASKGRSSRSDLEVQRETVVSPLTVGGTATVLQATQVDPDPAHHDRVDHR